MTPDTFPSLFAGYTAVWLLLVGYTVSIARRLKRVERELVELQDDKIDA